MSINLERMLQKRSAKPATTNLKDQTVDITHTVVSDVIGIFACENSTINISSSSRATKLVIDRCNNVTVLLDCDLMTEMVEISNCQTLKINFARATVKTVQIDNVQDASFTFTCKNPPRTTFVSSGNCNSLTIALNNLIFNSQFSVNHPIDESTDQDQLATTQFRTLFTKDYSSIITERIIREGCGYVTTEQEKTVADMRQSLYEQKIEQFVLEAVEIKQKEKTTIKSPPTSDPSLLNQINNFSHSSLKQTETKETSLLEVTGSDVIIGNSSSNNITGAITNDDELREYFDTDEKICEDVKLVAELIRNGKHVVVYTGAGISTTSGIPDYRGPSGVWTLQSKGESHKIKQFDIEQAYPTYCHYAISELVNRGLVKHVVSTNVDGLHRRSGLIGDQLSELHGNSYLETCTGCGKEFLRGFDVCKTVKNYSNHLTGRQCTRCNGELRDSIVHFSESLPETELSKADRHSEMADLTLVLGTSMRVQPACNLPLIPVRKGTGKMVIVNLQKTPFDNRAYLITRTKTDHFMQLLMHELGIDQVDQSFDALQELKQ